MRSARSALDGLDVYAQALVLDGQRWWLTEALDLSVDADGERARGR